MADRAGVPIAQSATARAAELARRNATVDEDSILARYAITLHDVLTPPPFIDEAIVDAFHRQLLENPHDELLWLLNHRGIWHTTVIDYKIGHDGDRFTIPIYDAEGHVVNIRRYKHDGEPKMLSWRAGYGASRLFPFPELIGIGPVYLMEGEWDCLLARQHGLPAITSTGGAGSWNDDWTSFLAGRDVVICYDNDDAGRAGAIMVATKLSTHSTPARIRVLDWRSCSIGIADGFDFTDWIVGGSSIAEFNDLIENAPMWMFTPVPPLPPAPETSGVGPDNLDDPVFFSDVGNARRLARRHGGDVRYVSRNWYVWDGTRYAHDETSEIDRCAKETARSMYHEALGYADDTLRQRLMKHSVASESAAKIRAMIDMAKSELPLAVSSSAMDTNPYLLNCENGTYDFQLHDMRDHRREDLITMSTSQVYDESEVCPMWDEFVLRTFDGNMDVIEFVQRAIGYSLVGVTTEQVLFFCYGTGANGKSTFLETVRHVVGDYARTADFSTFATQRGGHSGPRNDIMRLRNARFVTAIEFDAGRALDEVIIKQLTGGDTVSARRLYSESEEFRPTFTPWIAGNHKPVIKGTDEAIWRRLRLIPFNVTIPHGERDPHLRTRLETESPGILRWAIRGAESWQMMGLRPPQEVLMATQSYRNEMDTIEPFLEARTIRELNARTKASDLYNAYKQWAEESGEEPIARMLFSLRMGEKGFVSERRGGAQYRLGVRLRREGDLIDDMSQNGTNPESLTEARRTEIGVEPFEPRPPMW